MHDDLMFDWFKRIELEINCEISFADKFKLALYENTDGLWYSIGELSKSLDFFIDSGDERFDFVQDGANFILDMLDIEKPFWAIDKVADEERDAYSRRHLHELHYCAP